MRRIVEHFFALADVRINGDNPWDIQVHNPRFYARVLKGGSLGLGESYVDGWWDCKSLDQFFCKILKADLDKKVRYPKLEILSRFKSNIVNRQKGSKVFEVGKRHYDVGNDVFTCMLDRGMVYSCGYWNGVKNLDQAQEAKLDLICRKTGLKAGKKILDIGCGWGSFAKYAAEKYGTTVVGITISEKQVKLGRELCRGLPIEIRLQDYHDLNETFDYVISVGMFEHVGYKNYRIFMKVVRRCLKPNGLFLLHTIGRNTSIKAPNRWINKYIFPNYLIPSSKQIASSTEGLFVLEDWHNFGPDYDKTLMAWHENFTKKWDQIRTAYDQRFYRIWTYYLLSCAGAFRARRNQLWQIVYSINGAKGGYRSIR